MKRKRSVANGQSAEVVVGDEAEEVVGKRIVKDIPEKVGDPKGSKRTHEANCTQIVDLSDEPPPPKPPRRQLSRAKSEVSASGESAAVPAGPTLGELVAETVRRGERFLVLTSDVANGSPVTLPAGFSLEGDPALPQQVRVVCPCVCIAAPLTPAATGKVRVRGKAGMAESTSTLRRLILEGGASGLPVLLVPEDARTRLEDCILKSKGGGIRLNGEGATAGLCKCGISSHEVGVQANSGSKLTMQGCRITDCGADGISLDMPCSANVASCFIARNGENGVVVSVRQVSSETGPPTVSFLHNSIMQNGQFGIWANLGARLNWMGNWLEDNALGDRGGTGELEGWRSRGAYFKPREHCLVWLEETAQWLRGVVVGSEEGGFVRIELSEPAASSQKKRPTRSASNEERGIGSAKKKPASSVVEEASSSRQRVLVPHTALRPSEFTEAHYPPPWSKHGARKPTSAYQYFLRAQGLTKGDSSTKAKFKEPSAERAVAEQAAEADRARYEDEMQELKLARFEAKTERKPIVGRKLQRPGSLQGILSSARRVAKQRTTRSSSIVV